MQKHEILKTIKPDSVPVLDPERHDSPSCYLSHAAEYQREAIEIVRVFGAKQWSR